MKKLMNRVTDQALLIEILQKQASLDAQLNTLFAMQCELFPYLDKSQSPPIGEKWCQVRTEFFKENLADLSDPLLELAKQRG